jgi:hypothetical protein
MTTHESSVKTGDQGCHATKQLSAQLQQHAAAQSSKKASTNWLSREPNRNLSQTLKWQLACFLLSAAGGAALGDA